MKRSAEQQPSQRNGNRRFLTSLLVMLFTIVPVYSHAAGVQATERAWPVYTVFYPLRLQVFESAKIGDRGGGIARYGDALLLANRLGELFLVTDQGAFRALAYRVPFELAPFARHEKKLTHVGVHDIYLERADGELLIFASVDHWIEDRQCYALRVMLLRVPATALLTAATQRAWEEVFQTFPCIAPGTRKTHEALGLQAGGRMERLAAGKILLTVGDYHLDGLNGLDLVSDRASAYGKTFVIDYRTRHYEVFTTGHRNPQGLLVTGNGDIWLTEHGPKGGDELNRLQEGVDYGWPSVTYGTNYGSYVWPRSKQQGRHTGYARPFFAWTPSIAVSQLIEITQPMFEAWQGDLLISSLKQQNLYRLRIREGRTIFVEKMSLLRRVRDMVEMRDGTLAMKFDGNAIGFLRPGVHHIDIE